MILFYINCICIDINPCDSVQVMMNRLFQLSGSAGLRSALPIAAGYFAFDVAFGVAAVAAGVSVTNAMVMTLLVYAASAQMAALGLFAVGASPWAVIGVTLLLNIRYVLFSVGYAPQASRWGRQYSAFVAWMMTDASYAAMAGGRLHRKNDVFMLHAIPYLVCVVATYLGAKAGSLLPDFQAIGLDFALPGMFMALLVPMLDRSDKWFTAVLAAAVSVMIALAGGGGWAVPIAAMFASLLVISGHHEKNGKLSWFKF